VVFPVVGDFCHDAGVAFVCVVNAGAEQLPVSH